ncbi:MAG TPA: acyltransferase family protein, partial [Spirochaetota bacterium]|nr:acyltransferase family protein [Spirochaetota bacterium]
AFLIFLVVAGHVIESYIYQSRALFTAYGIIYSFHMPLFIFIAGYFSKNTGKCGRTAYRDILLPFFVFSPLYYLVTSAVNHRFAFSLLTPAWIYWFLLSLFFWRITISGISRIRFAIPVFIAFAIAAGFTGEIGRSLSLSRTICFAAFFVAGFHCDTLFVDRVRRHPIVCILATALILSAAGLIFFRQSGGAYSSLENAFYMADSYRSLGLSPLRGALTRAAILAAAFALVFSITGFFPRKKLIMVSRAGKNSLTVFLFHAYVIISLRKFFPSLETPVQTILILGALPLATTYLLSLDAVSRFYRATMNAISQPITKLFAA